MEKPTRAEVRAGAGTLAFFSGSAVLILLTTEPPPGNYYPWWSFALAGAGVVIGLGVVIATFVWPKSATPDRVTRRALDKMLRGQNLSRRERKRVEGREPQVHAPTISQGDRPGWRAFCSDAGYTGSDARHGVHLYLTSDKETARSIRCLVRQPGGRAAPLSVSGGQRGQEMVHYPADFSDAPALDEGEYTFEWLGYVGAEEHELFLAGNTFNVNEKRQVFCAETSVKSSGSSLGGAVGLRGSLGLKAIRHNQDVPEEETKAEWDADCRFVSASLNDPFGRGVYLSIKGKEDDPRDLRCVVTAPDNTQFASVRRRGAFGGGLRTDDMFHFPGEFRPKLGDEPWPRGYYRYVWTGDTADLVDDRSEVLAIRFFHVDDNGNITCHREVPSPATNPRPTWTLSTLEAVTESVALHRQKGDQIELALRKLDHVKNISVPTFVVCEVTHPNGLTSEAGRDFGLERAVMPLLLPASVRFDYPFEDLDAPLEDGAYAVEWFATVTRRGSPRFVLARDRFDVQSGRLGE